MCSSHKHHEIATNANQSQSWWPKKRRGWLGNGIKRGQIMQGIDVKNCSESTRQWETKL